MRNNTTTGKTKLGGGECDEWKDEVSYGFLFWELGKAVACPGRRLVLASGLKQRVYKEIVSLVQSQLF